MPSTGLRRLLIYCGDYKCAHHVEIDADRWQDDVRLSDLEPLFVCQACGHRGAMCGRYLTRTEPRAGERSLMAATGWKRSFDEPIPLPRGRQLVTLRDAGNYITKLAKAEHEAREWQAAMEALILVATLGGPAMFGH
jgi:hypothetical protein